MKKRSIKARVTGWYVFFLVLMFCLIFASLLYTSNQLIQQNIRGDLAAVVNDSLRDISIKNRQLEIDDDMISYRDGVSVLVYQENNFIITGTLPEGINQDIPFVPDKVRKISDSGKNFYVFDYLIRNKEFSDVWVRGITSAELKESDPALGFMMKLFFIFLPLLILFAALGGYYITKKAFLPVAQITQTARRISTGNDLSQRIQLPSAKASKDEIYHLASTFDTMLTRLERSFEAEKQFSNDASHELRTPVSVIMSQCEYALRNAASPEDAHAALKVILGQSQKMSALISQLLTLARADRGALKLEFETINVSDITAMVVLEQESLAKKRGIHLQQEIQPDLLASVDETLFMRVWINLISNSIKYGKDGGFTRIILKRSDDGSGITGQVIDNGIGISAEDLPKIWDRFYQANPSRNNENSCGLGLSMVRWIISAHQGTITADSIPNQETTFTFTLPSDHKKEKDDHERNFNET